MATEIIRPNGDVTVGFWTQDGLGTHAQDIDEAHNAPWDFGDNIEIHSDTDDSEAVFHLDNLGLGDDIIATNITIWGRGQFEGYKSGDVATAYVRYRVGGFGIWSSLKELTFVITGGESWQSVSWSISLSRNEVNSLQVGIRNDITTGDITLTIDVLYAVITHEPLVGYGHDFKGVPAVNIGSVNGVPTANISSISGV